MNSSETLQIDFTDVRRVERVVLDPTVALADNMNQKIRQICGDYLAEVSVIPKVEYIDRWNDNNVRVSDLCALKKATAKLSGICKDPPKEVNDDVTVTCDDVSQLVDLAAAATRHMVNEFEESIDSKPFFIPRKTFSITEFKLHQSDQAMIKARLQVEIKWRLCTEPYAEVSQYMSECEGAFRDGHQDFHFWEYEESNHRLVVDVDSGGSGFFLEEDRLLPRCRAHKLHR